MTFWRKINQTFFSILFYLSLLALLFTLPLYLVAFNSSFYQYIQEKIGLNVDEEIKKVDSALAQFFKGEKGINSLQSFFTQKELLHLKDIQGLLRLLLPVFWISTTIFILSSIGIYLWSNFFQKIKVGLIASLSLYLLCGLLLYFFFDQIFLFFHLSTFSNDYWILGESYLLYRLFPPQFFSSSLFPFFSLVFLLAALLFLLGWLVDRFSPRAHRALVSSR